MAGSLSYDLRRGFWRGGGGAFASRRRRAVRVSASSISRWRALERERGDARPKRWRRSEIASCRRAHAPAILAALGPDRDRTIDEVRAILREDNGLVFGFGAIQRFFKRHAITRKKRPRTLPNKTARHPEAP